MKEFKKLVTTQVTTLLTPTVMAALMAQRDADIIKFHASAVKSLDAIANEVGVTGTPYHLMGKKDVRAKVATHYKADTKKNKKAKELYYKHGINGYKYHMILTSMSETLIKDIVTKVISEAGHADRVVLQSLFKKQDLVLKSHIDKIKISLDSIKDSEEVAAVKSSVVYWLNKNLEGFTAEVLDGKEGAHDHVLSVDVDYMGMAEGYEHAKGKVASQTNFVEYENWKKVPRNNRYGFYNKEQIGHSMATINALQSQELYLDFGDMSKEGIRAILREAFGLDLLEDWGIKALDRLYNEYIEKRDNGFYNIYSQDRSGRLYCSQNYSIQSPKAIRAYLYRSDYVLTRPGVNNLKTYVVNQYKDGMIGKKKSMSIYKNELPAIISWAVAEKETKVLEAISLVDEGVGTITGFLMELDATNSVVQLMGVLLGDEDLFALGGGITEADLWEPAYKQFANDLNRLLGVTCFTAANVKYKFMTVLYNKSTKSQILGDEKLRKKLEETYTRSFVLEDIKDINYPISIILEQAGHSFEYNEMAEAFETAVNNISPLILKLRTLVHEILKGDKNAITVYKALLPDNFMLQFALFEEQDNHAKFIKPDLRTGQVKFITRELTPKKKLTSGSPTLMAGVDSFVLRGTTAKMYKLGVVVFPVHDAFYIGANDADALQKGYKEMLAMVFDANLLSNLLAQLCKQNGYKGEYSYKDVQKIFGGSLTKEMIMKSRFTCWY